MSSSIVKMLSFWHYQKLSKLDPEVKILYYILTPSRYFQPPPPPPPSPDDKVFFAFQIYLVKSLYHNYIHDFLNI